MRRRRSENTAARLPGLFSEPTAGCIFATQTPGGNPIDASYVLPLVEKVQHACQRVKAPHRLAIYSVAGDLGINDATVRQALHEQGMLTVGIPRPVAPINPQPTPPEVLDLLNAAGLNRKRTPYQVQLACVCGYSRSMWKVTLPVCSVAGPDRFATKVLREPRYRSA
jgi:hypothetical protein